MDLIFEIILLMDFSSKIEFHFPLSTFGGVSLPRPIRVSEPVVLCVGLVSFLMIFQLKMHCV